MKTITIQVDDNDAATLQEFLDEVPHTGKYWAIMFGVLLYQKLQSCSYPLSRTNGNRILNHIEDLFQHMAQEDKEKMLDETDGAFGKMA